MLEAQMFDSRAHPRYEVRSPITIDCAGVQADAELLNLSPSGACFHCAPGVPLGSNAVGSPVKLLGWGHEGGMLRTEGHVVRYNEEMEGASFGVKFD